MLHRGLNRLHEGPRFWGEPLAERTLMTISIDTEQCESTGVCAIVCPEDIIEIRNSLPVIINNLACTSCWKCAENCVSAAITVD
jgi:MinD superfamily P-loop ATPase